jgi:hypothetical protein
LFFDEIFEKLEPEECSEFIKLITKITEIGEQNSKKENYGEDAESWI